MTRRELARIVRLWQKRLGLERWALRIDWDEPAEDGARACIWRARDYDEATLFFDPAWPSWGDHVLEQLVVHELLHLVLRDVEFIGTLLQGHVKADVYEVVRRAHMHHVEQAVDRLAYRLTELGGSLA